MGTLLFVTSTRKPTPQRSLALITEQAAQNGDPSLREGVFRSEQSLKSLQQAVDVLSAHPTTGSSLGGDIRKLAFYDEAMTSKATRPCAICGTIRTSAALICRKCWSEAMFLTLICQQCGKEYLLRRCEASKRPPMFCSRACSNLSRRVVHPCRGCGEELTGNRRKTKTQICVRCYYNETHPLIPCYRCGQLFRKEQGEMNKRLRQGQTKFYCGHGCRSDELRTGHPPHPCDYCGGPVALIGRKYCSPECVKAARPPKKRKNCPQCGVEFEYSSARRVYCDRICANVAHSLRMVGTGNSRYKDGTISASLFRLMRPLIKERDGDVCRVCECPERLLIHHIDETPWHNQPENLITVCKTCHGVHHKSRQTPFPWFAQYAESATMSMTSRWKETVTSLQRKFASITV